MDIQQAAALFRAAQGNWPGSQLSQTPKYTVLTIGVGTPAEPVSIAITAQESKRFADVEIIAEATTIDDPVILAKLGGVLIQASNVVEQANALAGSE